MLRLVAVAGEATVPPLDRPRVGGVAGHATGLLVRLLFVQTGHGGVALGAAHQRLDLLLLLMAFLALHCRHGRA